MSSTLSILPAIWFIFIQVILMNIARGESLRLHKKPTHHVSSWISDRLKRVSHGTMLDRLHVQVKYPTGEEVQLNWVKVDEYLANQHLPVITPSDYLGTNVMENVGEFVIYHDVEKCSAVIYFKKFHTLFGVIGLDYIITNLPYKFDADGYYSGIVEEPYLTRRAGSPAHNEPFLDGSDDPEEPSDSSCGSSRNTKSTDSDPGEKMKHHRIARDVGGKNYGNVSNGSESKIRRRRGILDSEYYLETLVFVTSDVVEFFKILYGDKNHIEWVVKYYILYFNAVDMIFKKIRSVGMGLRINIAKIVIEDSTKPFEFLSDSDFQFSESIVKMREYLQSNQNIYTPDSFDHVFISTRRSIIDESRHVVGVTEHGADLYNAREQDEFYGGVPISVVGFLNDYSLGVQEISRILGIEVDSWTEELERAGQCNNIDQEEGSKCDSCLKWSDNSKEQFKVFFRNNRNRCFLLNEPRSVRPRGPSKFLTPSKQCRCFGYNSYISKYNSERKDHDGSDECNSPLQCTKPDGDQISCDYALRPFDGTTCGNDKVCWNRECVKYKPKRCQQKKKLLGRLFRTLI